MYTNLNLSIEFGSWSTVSRFDILQPIFTVVEFGAVILVRKEKVGLSWRAVWVRFQIAAHWTRFIVRPGQG